MISNSILRYTRQTFSTNPVIFQCTVENVTMKYLKMLCGKLEVLWSAAMKASTSQADFRWDQLLSTKPFQGNCFDCFAKIKPFSGYFSAYGKDFTFALSKRWHTCKSARVWVPCKFKGDILLQISQGCMRRFYGICILIVHKAFVPRAENKRHCCWCCSGRKKLVSRWLSPCLGCTYTDIFESANFSLRIQNFPRPHVFIIRIQIEVNRPRIRMPANLQNDLRLMRKFYRQSSSITVSLTKLSYQTLFPSFNLFTGSNSSVRHGKISFKMSTRCSA